MRLLRQASAARFLILAIAVLPLAFNACEPCGDSANGASFTCAFGTGTGNPMSASSAMASSQQQSFPATPATETLAIAVCAALSRCNVGLEYSSCMDGVLSAPGAGPELGATSMPTEAYRELFGAERVGRLVSSAAATNTCSMKLAQLACNSAEIKSAYKPATAAPFANLQAIFDPSCRAVLSSSR